jgi:hypothetical protein
MIWLLVGFFQPIDARLTFLKMKFNYLDFAGCHFLNFKLLITDWIPMGMASGAQFHAVFLLKLS